MPAPDPNRKPRPRRSFRVSLEAALAGLVALALIVVILAGVFSLGERRLGDVRTAMPGVIAPAHPTDRGTPGLRVPRPLPQARVRPADSVAMPNPAMAAAPLEPAPTEAAFAPADGAPAAPAAPAAPFAVAPPFEAAPPPASLAPNVQPRVPLGESLGFLQFTKIRDAYLTRPDPIVNPANLPRPQSTSDLAQARSQSRLTPQGVRELVAERQATQSLWQLRSQAKINPNRAASPAAQPSAR